ncbi:MAG: cache domain-containing protein [Halioglobus sp.]|nr:cache domain-containing protein [Halioglobus sp.]
MSRGRYWLVVVSALALATLLSGWVVNRYQINERIEAVGDRLVLLGALRHGALQRYLDTAEAELRFWSVNRFFIAEQDWVVSAWREGLAAGHDPAASLRQRYIEGKEISADGQSHNAAIYDALHERIHPMAKRFVTERGYYDFFLISPDGDIHYSVLKEDDFATNLLTGPYKDTGLGEVFRQVIQAPDSDAVRVSDLQAYPPSDYAPAMFLARAMFHKSGDLLGVIALQVPTDRIHKIMQFDAGMGETGETYLVGVDYLMRSESRFSDVSTVLRQRVDSATVARALQGESGVEFTPDYRGIDVLSAYSSIPVGDTRWAVMAEMDKSEILEPAANRRPVIAGFLLGFFSLGLWSAWFIQRGQTPGKGGQTLTGLDTDL